MQRVIGAVGTKQGRMSVERRRLEPDSVQRQPQEPPTVHDLIEFDRRGQQQLRSDNPPLVVGTQDGDAVGDVGSLAGVLFGLLEQLLELRARQQDAPLFHSENGVEIEAGTYISVGRLGGVEAGDWASED